MKEELKILIIEDIKEDAELMKIELKKKGLRFVSKVVEFEKDFIDELERFEPDIILSDFTLPQFDGMSALKIAREYSPSTPFIILTGTLSEETA